MSSDDSSYSKHDDDDGDGYWMAVVIPIGVLVLLYFRYWLEQKLRRLPDNQFRTLTLAANQRQQGSNNDSSDNDNHNDNVNRRKQEDLRKLSLDDWEHLFSMGFENNRNQIRLDSKHFWNKCGENDTNKNKDAKNTGMVEESEADWSFATDVDVDIESAFSPAAPGDTSTSDTGSCGRALLAIVLAAAQEEDNGEDLVAASIGSDADADSPCDNDATTKERNASMISERYGNDNRGSNICCIICFEDLRVGEEIVWASSNNAKRNNSGGSSNDNAKDKGNHCQHQCTHVYHKTCMVQYLASNANRNFRKGQRQQQQQQGRNNNNYSNNNSNQQQQQLQRDDESDNGGTGTNIPSGNSSRYGMSNPCPVCRQQFCVLSDHDIEAVIQSKDMPLSESDSEASKESPPAGFELSSSSSSSSTEDRGRAYSLPDDIESATT
eukprot:CAMPEP_0168210302 /NCGR_PEP_ID=MMETSP0140_2-20121125/3100_1 /TAXON_ID=44445 /ORGANISM="Pseudo-nitzschia australis, Strain 10249 10 AB" /LENGTH=436 /DNA_ID=CAMNT_0008136899 /DNA_START=138 /DNA_END=1445 /DNA_ORIENTATION=+